MSRASGYLGVLCCLAAAARAEETKPRYAAPIEIERPGAFVRMQVPPEAYAHSLRPGLGDLRVVDAGGERVPFAFLPRHVESKAERLAVTLYALPPKPAGAKWVSPVEVTVVGEQLTVRRAGGRAASATSAASNEVARSAGWLLDLGARKPGEEAPQSLTLEWSGPEQFSVGFDFDMSDDLRTWRGGGSGQLMALASASGPIRQPTIALPPAPGRFLRLVWSDLENPPAVTGAWANVARHVDATEDAPRLLRFTAADAPASEKPVDPAAHRALRFDLGAALPLSHLDLQFATGTHVAPVRIDSRRSAEDPWRELAWTAFYRVERGGNISSSAPLAVQAVARFVRVTPDERAAALDAAQTSLVVEAELATLVFAAQGKPPYRLLAGAPDGSVGALPVESVVPSLEAERGHFGEASLGAWTEDVEVARQIAAQRRTAALRPWLLWSVLLGGVGGLVFMVWRLARPSGG